VLKVVHPNLFKGTAAPKYIFVKRPGKKGFKAVLVGTHKHHHHHGFGRLGFLLRALRRHHNLLHGFAGIAKHLHHHRHHHFGRFASLLRQLKKHHHLGGFEAIARRFSHHQLFKKHLGFLIHHLNRHRVLSIHGHLFRSQMFRGLLKRYKHRFGFLHKQFRNQRFGFLHRLRHHHRFRHHHKRHHHGRKHHKRHHHGRKHKFHKRRHHKKEKNSKVVGSKKVLLVIAKQQAHNYEAEFLKCQKRLVVIRQSKIKAFKNYKNAKKIMIYVYQLLKNNKELEQE